MKAFTIISEELMIQKTAKTLITKKTVKTVAEEVVNKFVIMAKLKSGVLVFGINESREEAIKEIERQA